mmetsp:Transcript_26499/g.62036  ORF Transcript_26499/g.62036 Transcript_26499/m.62036 type:complete len:277 (-) Transcript_26499:39-869(-)
MTNFKTSIANFFAFLFLFGAQSSVARKDDVDVFEDVADAYHVYQSSRYKEDSVPIEANTDLASGIFRGEASPSTSEREGRMSGPAKSSGSTIANANTVDISDGHALCVEDTESIISLNEDIRLELSAIDTRYLENASIDNVCDRDDKYSNCNFDFRLFPNKLQNVCQQYGDEFFETEHSIQCHNPITKESLYYQFDHYPSCFSAFCKQEDVKQLLARRIDAITQAMEEYLDMSCFADDDILRHADDTILIESSGIQRSWAGIEMFPIATSLLLFFL